MKSNSLDLRAVVVVREGAALTAPITLSLAGGEILAIRGRNGSGKSSLLKTMAGLIPTASGDIMLNGQQPSEQKVIYMGHKNGLVREMDVRDNVVFWARLNGCIELTAVAMHYFELEDIADVPVKKLSAGWQQRVALTRLITTPSNFWFLDEPTSHLDTEGVALLQSLLQTRAEQGGIIAIATHVPLQGESIKQLNISVIN